MTRMVDMKHPSALAYTVGKGKLVAVELDHCAHPESARRWRQRGLRVEIVEKAEAVSRWRDTERGTS